MPPSEAGLGGPWCGGLSGFEVMAYQVSGSGSSAWTRLPEASSSRLSHIVAHAASSAPLGSFL